MSIKPKTVFIGLEKLGRILEKNRTDLDFVTFCDSIEQLTSGLEDETISNEIEIIITIDQFFDVDNETQELENLVALLSPYCLMIIIQYNPEFENLIKERIRQAAILLEVEGNEEYYFISPNKPNVGIDFAKSAYINNHPESEIAYILQGIDPNELDEEIYEEEVENEPIVEVVPDLDGTPGKGKIVAVTSVKGGTGVSTIATLLTSYISHASQKAHKAKKTRKEKPLKVCLLDLNIRNGQIGFIIGALRPSILKLRSEGITKEVLQETAIYSEQLKADCILMPEKAYLSETLTLEFILDTLEFLKKHYDYIIIDTASSFVGVELDLTEKVIFPTADLIIYVTDCSSTSLLSMARWVETVKAPKTKDGMNIPIEKIGVVVNDYIPDLGIDGEKIAQLSRGLPILTVLPSKRKLAIKATNQQSLSAILRDNSFKEAIQQLAIAVVGDEHELADEIF